MSGEYRGYNQENIQDINRTIILNLLRKEGVCARVLLANLSQLKQATVTNITGDFIKWGLVKEVGFLTGSKGRRSIGISINNDDFGILAIRLARKNYSVGVFDLSGTQVSVKRVELDVNQPAKITFQAIIEDAKKLIRSSKPRKIIAFGMAIPGPYSSKRGRIELMTGVTGWSDIPIRETLTDLFHVPVFMEQDANCGALAQFWYNADSFQNGLVVYIAIGQGVGAGIINNGELLKGSIGVAGEIGHTSIDLNGPRCSCGNYGCLENYCSSIAFTKKVNDVLKPKKPYTFQEAAALLQSGDKKVRQIFLELCERLAVGIVNITNSFNPTVIVLGDEMSHIAPDLMLKQVKESVKERVIPEIYDNMSITMSLVASDSIIHGAAIVAIEDVFEHPGNYFERTRKK